MTWEKIVDHIDHAVKIAGMDHVGAGLDFDGTSLPLGNGRRVEAAEDYAGAARSGVTASRIFRRSSVAISFA